MSVDAQQIGQIRELLSGWHSFIALSRGQIQWLLQRVEQTEAQRETLIAARDEMRKERDLANGHARVAEAARWHAEQGESLADAQTAKALDRASAAEAEVARLSSQLAGMRQALTEIHARAVATCERPGCGIEDTDDMIAIKELSSTALHAAQGSPTPCTCGSADPQSARYQQPHLTWCGAREGSPTQVLSGKHAQYQRDCEDAASLGSADAKAECIRQGWWKSDGPTKDEGPNG